MVKKIGIVEWLNEAANEEQAQCYSDMLRYAAERIRELEAALVKIERLGSDGEHSGDRHAQCRAIAQSALAASRKETP